MTYDYCQIRKLSKLNESSGLAIHYLTVDSATGAERTGCGDRVRDYDGEHAKLVPIAPNDVHTVETIGFCARNGCKKPLAELR